MYTLITYKIPEYVTHAKNGKIVSGLHGDIFYMNMDDE